VEFVEYILFERLEPDEEMLRISSGGVDSAETQSVKWGEVWSVGTGSRGHSENCARE
jgi:hypothetical protein